LQGSPSTAQQYAEIYSFKNSCYKNINIYERNKNMAKNYTYKESRVTTKKLVGMYDAGKCTIEVDGEDKKIIDEMKDFEGAIVEVSIKVKQETDLSE